VIVVDEDSFLKITNARKKNPLRQLDVGGGGDCLFTLHGHTGHHLEIRAAAIEILKDSWNYC